MPFVNPKTDHEHTLSPTTPPHLTTPPNFDTISRSINQSKSFSDRNEFDSTGAAAGAGYTASVAATPSLIYSDTNSLFIPASTSKYPIKQNTIAADLRERVINFGAHWIRAFVYLARK